MKLHTDEVHAPSYKTVFMLNVAEHEIFFANRYENANILIFISRDIFMISYIYRERLCNFE